MEIRFSLSYEDYLQSQLYSASTESSVKKRRMILQIVLTLGYIGIGVYNYFVYGLSLATIAFAVVGVLFYFLYPMYSAWSYKNVLRKRTQIMFKDYVGKENKIILSKKAVQLVTIDNTSTCAVKDIEFFSELPDHFIFKLKLGQMLLLPKAEVENVDEFLAYVSSMNIEMRKETHWKWK